MHGNGPAEAVGSEPEGAGLADQGMGWINSNETGVGQFTVTSGLEGAWTPTPTQWDNKYLETLFSHEWELVESPAGAKQWQPREVKDGFMVPPVEAGAPETKPTMSTADMAMITDPAYLEISKRFYENPDQLADAFARAWFKLLHRDMGPAIRYVGPQAPGEELPWQDNVPASSGSVIGDAEIAELKSTILDSGLTTDQLVKTAWASASTYRRTDYRGGANGARIRLEPQRSWDVNVQAGVGPVIDKLEQIQGAFNGKGGAQVSLADLIVLGGTAGVEAAAKAAGHDITVPFTPGPDRRRPGRHRRRVLLLSRAQGRWLPQLRRQAGRRADRAPAHRQGLHAQPLGARDDRTGRRAPSARQQRRLRGLMACSRSRPGQLSTDFFTNLLDMGVKWSAVGEAEDVFEGHDRSTGERTWTGTRVDLVFGSNSQLRAIAEEYGADRRRRSVPRRLRLRLGEGHGERPIRSSTDIEALTRIPPVGRCDLAAPHRRVRGRRSSRARSCRQDGQVSAKAAPAIARVASPAPFRSHRSTGATVSDNDPADEDQDLGRDPADSDAVVDGSDAAVEPGAEETDGPDEADGDAEPVVGSGTDSRPMPDPADAAIGTPAPRRRLRRVLRALLVVVVIASVLGAIAVVWPIFDDRVLQPVQDNAIETAAIENRLDQTDDRLGEIEQQITQLGEDLDGLRGTQDDLGGSLDALGVRIEDLTTELQRLDGLETDLGDLGERLDREVAVLRSMELMSRARLFLYQANYGLAEQDVAAAKSVLEASRSVGSGVSG